MFGDVRIAFDGGLADFTTTEIASHGPGIGSRDWTAAAGSQTTYRHGDQIGSMRMLTYDGASVGRQAVYTAFGERVWSDGSIGATRYQYAGAWGYQTFPEHTGQPGDALPWIHVGHRWYDPSTGRFLLRDPIGIRGGLNQYLYVANNPILGIDPWGKQVYVNRGPGGVPVRDNYGVFPNEGGALPPTCAPPFISPAANNALATVYLLDGCPAMAEGAILADVVTTIFVYPMQWVGLVPNDYQFGDISRSVGNTVVDQLTGSNRKTRQ